MIAAILMLAQALYWLLLRDVTEEMDEVVWDACLYPGASR